MRLRKLLPFIIFFSCVIIGLTAMALSFSPKGYAPKWTFAWLSKDELIALNVNFVELALISLLLLLIIRWKSFMEYLNNLNLDFYLFRKRFLVTLSVVMMFVFGTLTTFSVSDYFISDDTKISEEIEQEKIDEKEEKIEEDIEAEIKLDELILEENKKEVPKVEEIKKEIKEEVVIEGSLPTLNLKEVAQKYDLELKRIVSLLKVKGLDNVDENMNVKIAADELGISPEKLIKMFKNQPKY